MSLAKKITDLRKERNLTQKELAKSIGVHFSHMSRYERGISLPSIDVVKKIAQVFSVSTDYLLLDDDQVCLATTISDPELLPLFEAVSQMPEQEKRRSKSSWEAWSLSTRLNNSSKNARCFLRRHLYCPPRLQSCPGSPPPSQHSYGSMSMAQSTPSNKYCTPSLALPHPSQRVGTDPARPCLSEKTSAFTYGGAGRVDIIDEQNRLASTGVRGLEREGAAHILAALRRRQANLRHGGALAHQDICPEWNAGVLAQRGSQGQGLIELPLAQFRTMERNRH
jgi:transcriptional regulator with XRE-family HTH domain